MTKHTAKASNCPECDYDLLARDPGDRCPECGGEIPPQSSARLDRIHRMKAEANVTLALVITSFVVGFTLLIVIGSGRAFVEIPFAIALALGPSAFILLVPGGIVAWLTYTPFTVIFAFLAVYYRHSREAKYLFWTLFGLSWMFMGMCYWGIPV